MPGEMPAGRIRITMEHFLALTHDRPDKEKWELIDGVPIMMAPPSLVHQRISKNIERMLDARLLVSKPEWQADREIGVLLPDDERYSPEPDVTVIDADVELGQIYATRFYFVAEVLSNSDKQWMRELKITYYQSYPACVGILFVRQDRIEADLHVRAEGWTVRTLVVRADRIEIPVIGDIGRLEELYKSTPLFIA